jgi:hypothetical protein
VIKVEGGEKEDGEEHMPPKKTRKRKRKRSSTYIIVSGIAFLLAFYIYYVTGNVIFPLILVILGIGIAVSSL